MVSFIIDTITAADVESKIIRINVSNMPYFPGLNTENDTNYDIKIKIGQEVCEAVYRSRNGRSGILRIGSEIYVDKLRLKPNDVLLVKVLEENELFEISKL